MSRYPQASDYGGNNQGHHHHHQQAHPPVPQYEQNGTGHFHQNPYQGQPPAHGHVVQMNQQHGGGGGHGNRQHTHHYGGGEEAAFWGSNPEAKEPMEYNRKETVDSLIVQGEPIYSEDVCTANPELRKFRNQGYQDVWASVLFAISFFGTIVVAAINGANGKVSFSSDSSSSSTSVNGEPILVGLVKGAGVGLGFSVVFCIIMLFAMRAAPYGFIVVCNILAVCLMLGIAILGFMIGSTFLGVVGILLTLLIAAWLYCVRHFIPFSALMLETATHVVLHNFGAVGYAFGIVVVLVGYYVAWSAMVTPTLDDLTQSNNTTAAGGIMIVFALMIFWAEQVAHNVAHVTSAGLMASFYYLGGLERMPNTAASASFVRAITTSFGSICFGSLIVAIIKTIEFIVRSTMRGSRNGFCQCIAICILQCIEAILRYFNRLAFSFVAIFGISYIEAGKMTWSFVMDGSVWGALINDILLERVFLLVNLAQAAISATIVWFIFENWVALIGAILMSIGTGLIIFNVVDSASITLMVATATSPEVLPEKHPELSRKMRVAMSELRKGGCCDGDDGDY